MRLEASVCHSLQATKERHVVQTSSLLMTQLPWKEMRHSTSVPTPSSMIPESTGTVTIIDDDGEIINHPCLHSFICILAWGELIYVNMHANYNTMQLRT